jgi:hypothetical protein
MHVSFRQLFIILFALFAVLLATSILFAWSGPTQSPPAGNVSAPVNIGSASSPNVHQTKNDWLSVNLLDTNAFTVNGSAYIQNKLGINNPNPTVALQVVGTMILGNGGELCQSVTEGAIRYNSSSKIMEYCDGSSWKTL